MKRLALALVCVLGSAATAVAFEIPGCPPAKVNLHIKNEDKRVEKLVNLWSDIALLNEASPAAAYCLSDARMANGQNGLSFGFSQFDLKSNPRAEKILAKILTSATTDDLDAALSAREIAAIGNGKLSKFASVFRASDDAELLDLIRRTNDVLGTDAARAQINQFHIDGSGEAVKLVLKRIAVPDIMAGSPALQDSTLSILMLIDYNNFVNSWGDQSQGYYAGRPQRRLGELISNTGGGTFTDVMRFYLYTLQGSRRAATNRDDVLRRLSNVVSVYEKSEGRVELTDADIDFLVDELVPMLADNSYEAVQNKLRRGEYDALNRLVSRAKLKRGVI